MFKFVALCAVIAATAAEPGFLATPLAYTSIASPLAYKAAIAPGYISHAGSYIQPTVYSTPYGYSHLIKKRSAIAYSSYIAPSTYVAPVATYGAPLTTYSAPIVSSTIYRSPIAFTHLIKKRAAPLAIPYLARTTYASPVLSYSARLYPSPYLHTPLTYAHYIKK